MAIEFRNTFYKYPKGYDALSGVSCTIPDAKITLLVGASGAGKTTMCDILRGKLQANGVLIDGNELSSCSPERWPVFSSEDIVAYGEANKKGTLDEFLQCNPIEITKGKSRHSTPPFSRGELFEIMEALEITDYHDRHPRALSGGQRVRAGLARALLWKVKLYVVDTDLDPNLVDWFIHSCSTIVNKRGTSILWTRSNAALNSYMGDYFIALQRGIVVAEGRSQDICTCPPHFFVARFLWRQVNEIADHSLFQFESDKHIDPEDYFLISPYGLSFAPEGEGVVKAELTEIYSRGAFTECFVKVGNQPLSFFHYGVCPYEVGDTVTLDVDVDEVYILRHEDQKMERIF